MMSRVFLCSRRSRSFPAQTPQRPKLDAAFYRASVINPARADRAAKSTRGGKVDVSKVTARLRELDAK